MEINQETSLKELICGMIPESMEIIRGTVISASPLRIQAVNDQKLVLHGNIICLPRHLSDYTATCDISGGSLNSQTTTDGEHGHNAATDGEHGHNATTEGIHGHNVSIENAGEHDHSSEVDADGDHTHPAALSDSGAHTHDISSNGSHTHDISSNGIHSHTLATFSVTGATIRINNALKVGESVFILSFNQGKKYYILDREA